MTLMQDRNTSVLEVYVRNRQELRQAFLKLLLALAKAGFNYSKESHVDRAIKDMDSKLRDLQ